MRIGALLLSVSAFALVSLLALWLPRLGHPYLSIPLILLASLFMLGVFARVGIATWRVGQGALARVAWVVALVVGYPAAWLVGMNVAMAVSSMLGHHA